MPQYIQEYLPDKPWSIREYTGPAFIDVGVGTPEKIDIKNGLMVKNGYFYRLHTCPINLNHECTMFLLIPWNKENPKADQCRKRSCLLNYERIEELD